MIESNGLPCVFDVASGTGLSGSALVFIIFLVAGVAGGRCLSKFGSRFVAGLAWDLVEVSMGAAQHKIGLGVVEGLLVEGGDLRGSALMFCMALAAFAGFLETAMEPPCLVEIAADVCMAGET